MRVQLVLIHLYISVTGNNKLNEGATCINKPWYKCNLHW